ncbi:hypothetical protein P4O66_008446 [Electrophorus voltai]|uniref:Uncharacterized protein n=1 Tax=Electrophorus voltai TaxID=2609070 RepID=A0AAD8ZCV5_9TELE|nr:hypothetical protein P4O66_008446 [Electrophorus voltai]
MWSDITAKENAQAPGNASGLQDNGAASAVTPTIDSKLWVSMSVHWTADTKYHYRKETVKEKRMYRGQHRQR